MLIIPFVPKAAEFRHKVCTKAKGSGIPLFLCMKLIQPDIHALTVFLDIYFISQHLLSAADLHGFIISFPFLKLFHVIIQWEVPDFWFFFMFSFK